MPYYSLDTYAGDSAVLRWRNAELGTLYNVRLVGSDGSDTTFVTADTTITLNQLSDSVHYNVMLRRQCHLATSNYDTTVYSDWLSYISFGNSIVDTTGGGGSGGGGTEGIGDVVDHGLHVTALEGCIVVQGLAAGQRAGVYDMLGRRVAELAADGRTEALPQGVYMVRTGQSRARKVVVLR
ncbi:MAG: T9SS type A sorting domain-containing protein [Bacteroidales bacterium]|nr:T9SS type A sorting domain-containing protein [Bacteroidales bacterium]